ncbi:MAG: hypothetical protein NT004_02420 [Bacteroidetes bacterium]|nr:hypothetical protein [Bacteroidota bacterium]
MIIDKSKLIEKAKDVFDAHPLEEKIIVTGDGNFFLTNAIGLVRDHCRKAGVTMFFVSRSEAYPAEAEAANVTTETAVQEGLTEQLPKAKTQAKSKKQQ